MVFIYANNYHSYLYAFGIFPYAHRNAAMSTRVSSLLAQPGASPLAGWRRHVLPSELGVCYADRLALDDGLMLVHSHYRPARDLIEENIAGDGRRTLVITVAMQGVSAYHSDEGVALAFRQGATTVTAFRQSRGERRYAAGETVSQLRLLVGEQILRRYAGDARADDLLGDGGLRRLSQADTTPDLRAAASELASGQDPLDTHIRALGLLARQLRALAPAAEPGRLSQTDITRLEAARTLMQTQMDRELTVDYLCLATGLNAFKLKAGFRKHFGTSPHRLLTELRMRRAWELLETGCQVAQAAYRVGYRHPANFSAAFTRFYGRTPKSVFGKRSG